MSARSGGVDAAARVAGVDGEFAFSAADFERVRALILKKAGISLSDAKQAMVYSRLSRRLRELGFRSFDRYLDALEQGRHPCGESEWQEFVNALTTNLTSFFRESHHFPVLAAELRARTTRGAVRVWCNAASTGEEPYSIAMTVAETLGGAAPVKVVCSDIDTKVLATAAQGIYPEGSRGLDETLRRKYFLRGSGANAGSMRVKPELRSLVEFRAFNLIAPQASLGEAFDIVFCRNVMIYFDAPTQRAVLELMHRSMAPGSVLFAGHSENFNDSRDLFRLRGKTVYERV